MTMSDCCYKCSIVIDEAHPAQIWDGKPYCTACIDAAGLGEFSPEELEEHVEFTVQESVKRGLWSYFYGTGVIVLSMLSLLMVLMPLDFMGKTLGGNGFVGRYVVTFPLFLLMMAGMFWGMVSLLSFPLLFFAAVLSRTRTIKVRDGVFVFKTYSRQEKALLSECKWEIKENAGEDFGYFRLGRPLMVVTMNPPSGNRLPCRAVCGFDPRKLQMWRGFFELAGVSHAQQNWRQWIVPLAKGALFGGIAGVVFGSFVWLLTDRRAWVGVGFTTGALDGLLAVGFFLKISSLSFAEYKKQFGIWTPLMVACAFACFGAVAEKMPLNFNPLYYMALNAILGAIVGFDLHRRVTERAANEIETNSTVGVVDDEI